ANAWLESTTAIAVAPASINRFIVVSLVGNGLTDPYPHCGRVMDVPGLMLSFYGLNGTLISAVAVLQRRAASPDCEVRRSLPTTCRPHDALRLGKKLESEIVSPLTH